MKMVGLSKTTKRCRLKLSGHLPRLEQRFQNVQSYFGTTLHCSMRILRRVRRLVRFAAFGLVVAAVATELSKPEPERTWEGRVAGLVPYDFRPPTWKRI